MKGSNQVSLFLNTASKVLEEGLLVGSSSLTVELGDSKAALERAHLGIKMLTDAYSITLADVDAFYCLLGPGSNTGIRLGLTIPRTVYAFNPNIKCFGIPTLDLMCEKAPFAALSDRNGNFYLGEKKDGKVSIKRVDKKDASTLNSLPSITLEKADKMAHEEIHNPNAIDISIIDEMIANREKFKDFSQDEENYLPEYLLKI